jgi:hypothetical protein
MVTAPKVARSGSRYLKQSQGSRRANAGGIEAPSWDWNSASSKCSESLTR